jgi:hypothetical protein
MRQRITKEQLDELTPEQKERLRGWWTPAEGDWYFLTRPYDKMQFTCLFKLLPSEDISRFLWHDCLPLLSIGQCIELLNGIDPAEWTVANSNSDGWSIVSSNLYGPDRYCVVQEDGTDFEELIDALWSAIKKVL